MNYKANLEYVTDLERNEFCFKFDESGDIKWMHFWPADCKCAISIPIEPYKNDKGHSWKLSGSYEKPTVWPSINCEPLHWHGWISNGIATKCG